MRIVSAGLVALAVICAAERPALAQDSSATLNASATLAPPPVAGVGFQNLDFGTLAVGATSDVLPGPPSGGVSSAGWQFAGVRKNRTISWTFTLPPVLTSGLHQLPVDWDNAGYGSFCASRGTGCAYSATFNPGANGATWTMSIPNNTPGNNYDVTIYAGARTVVPSVPPGVYTASVVLSMAYLF